MTATVELYGMSGCPYTAEVREHLMWNGTSFAEFDVEVDAAARERLRQLTGNRSEVPVVVEDGRVKEVGWRGRSCICP